MLLVRGGALTLTLPRAPADAGWRRSLSQLLRN
jgi:hypothetical protein